MARSASTKHKVWRAVVFCLVLVNLLFSVGEGLHLTPFQPHASTNETSISNAFTQFQLNPIELTLIRKGESRHTTNAEILPSAFRIDPATLQILDTTIQVNGFIGSSYDSLFAGRAPPQSLKYT